jgi:glycosyltransferase involved in cell wall biosynthesis
MTNQELRTKDEGADDEPLSFVFRRTTVSAIITGYNYARFLPAAIESVLAQTCVPDEIIVVDDGSTDNTAEVVAPYAGKGVRYLRRENGGPGAARNTGIRASSGDLIAMLDGDDRWLPDKTALQLAHMEKYPSVGLVTGSEIQVHEADGSRYPLRRGPVGAASYYPWILVENTIGNPSLAMVRRECFERVGVFDEGLPLGQDWEMWIRIARSFDVGVVDADLIFFTRHAASLSTGRLGERYKYNKKIQRRYIRQIRSPFMRLRLLLAGRSMTLYYAAAEMADQTSERRRALRSALGAALLDPFYESRNKAAMLVSLTFGRSAVGFIKQLANRLTSR